MCVGVVAAEGLKLRRGLRIAEYVCSCVSFCATEAYSSGLYVRGCGCCGGFETSEDCGLRRAAED